MTYNRKNTLTHRIQKITTGINKLCNINPYLLVITLTVLVGILSLMPALSSLMENTTIKNIGQILATTIWAKSGTPEDIQAAVDAAAAVGGGTVYIPEGEWTFNLDGDWMQPIGIGDELAAVIVPGGVNIIGAGIGKTILQITEIPPEPRRWMFYLDGGSDYKPSRVSGISFRGFANGDYPDGWTKCCMRIRNMLDFRIDHCEFIDFADYSICIGQVWEGPKSRGVVDHCIFDMPSKETYYTSWGYAVSVTGSWDSYADFRDLLGKYEDIPTTIPVVYVEDCVARRCRYLVASNQGGWYVARHNNVSAMCGSNPPAAFDVHEGAPDAPGGLGGEFYDNYIEYDHHPKGWPDMVGIQLRAGSGVIYNNTFKDLRNAVQLYLMYDWCKDSEWNYPHHYYIWGNNLINTEDIIRTNDDTFFQENYHYFLRAPNLQQDGFEYTPYPYPHPLTLVP